MKLLSILLASIWAGTAAAQGILIGSPPEGKNICAGQNLTIQVIRPEHIESAIEAGLVIGFMSCATTPSDCSPSQLGTILYNGPYDPEFHGPGQQYENLTVTIPTGIPKGAAQIAIARFFLIGAGPSPSFGQANVTVNVK